jgi:hypothetical protein
MRRYHFILKDLLRAGIVNLRAMPGSDHVTGGVSVAKIRMTGANGWQIEDKNECELNQ